MPVDLQSYSTKGPLDPYKLLVDLRKIVDLTNRLEARSNTTERQIETITRTVEVVAGDGSGGGGGPIPPPIGPFATVIVDRALEGNGTAGLPINVRVDGTTVVINGSNQLTSVSTPPAADTLTGTLTPTRVPFASAAHVLSDSANLFWDNVNGRLGIGNAAPSTTLHVTGSARITSLTAARVPFASTGGLLVDQTNFVFDTANTRLGIGNAAPAETLHVTGTARITSLTTPRIPYASTGGLLADNAALFWNNTPQTLTVVHGGGVLDAAATNEKPSIHVGGDFDGVAAGIGVIYADGYGAQPNFTMRRASGTQASKTAVADAGIIFNFRSYAWDGSDYGLGGLMRMTANGLQSGTNHGQDFVVLLTANGSTATPAERMRLRGNGSLAVGQTADPGADSVLVGTIVGGTGVNDDLHLKATTGVGTVNSRVFIDVSSNGSVAAVEIKPDAALTGGQMGVGTAGNFTVSCPLAIFGTTVDLGYIIQARAANGTPNCFSQMQTGNGANAQAGFSFNQRTNSVEWLMAVVGNDSDAMRWTVITGGGATTTIVGYFTKTFNMILDNVHSDPASGSKVFVIGDGTAPGNLATNSAAFYANDVGGTVEMFAKNEANVVNQLTGVDNTYTPTRSAEVNLDANVTPSVAQYMRNGNYVTVSGRFTANPTTATVATSFELSLPIASNIGAIADLAGTAVCGAIASMCAEIQGSVANNTAVFKWIATDVASQSWAYIYSYRVI